MSSEVIRGISDIIACELQALQGEFWQPRLAADRSESEMTFRRKRIQELRRMREEFENLIYGFERAEV